MNKLLLLYQMSIFSSNCLNLIYIFSSCSIRIEYFILWKDHPTHEKNAAPQQKQSCHTGPPIRIQVVLMLEATKGHGDVVSKRQHWQRYSAARCPVAADPLRKKITCQSPRPSPPAWPLVRLPGAAPSARHGRRR